MFGVDIVTETMLGRAVWQRWVASGANASLLDWQDVLAGFDLTECNSAFCEAVLVRDSLAIDCVLDANPDWASASAAVSLLIEKGWAVTVVAPLPTLGLAHQCLRESSAMLQGWWLRNDSQVSFTSQEVA